MTRRAPLPGRRGPRRSGRIVSSAAIAGLVATAAVVAEASASESPTTAPVSAAAPAGASARAASPLPVEPIAWHGCPAGFVGQLRGSLQTRRGEDALDRMVCGRIDVPLDHTGPGGATRSVFVTRIPARDGTAERGRLIVNPGGPGGEAASFPLVTLDQGQTGFDKWYDLIGFDTRGVSGSDRISCAGVPAGIPSVGDVDHWRRWVSNNARRVKRLNDRCYDRYGPRVLAQYTTENVARDMERVRIAVGGGRVSYWGMSWGSLLGDAYQTLYPGSVKAMVLDSVLTQRFNLFRFEDDYLAQSNKALHGFARWVAARRGTYHLGKTPGRVIAHLQEIQGSTDDLRQTVTWAFKGLAPSQYADLARYLSRVDKGAAGKRPDGLNASKPSPGWVYEEFNETVFMVNACNDNLGTTKVKAWARHTAQLVRRYPVVGFQATVMSFCVGWRTHSGRVPTRETAASRRVLLGRHTYENVTPPVWTGQMRSVLRSPRVVVVDDNQHASLAFRRCSNIGWEWLHTRTLVDNRC